MKFPIAQSTSSAFQCSSNLLTFVEIFISIFFYLCTLQIRYFKTSDAKKIAEKATNLEIEGNKEQPVSMLINKRMK